MRPAVFQFRIVHHPGHRVCRVVYGQDVEEGRAFRFQRVAGHEVVAAPREVADGRCDEYVGTAVEDVFVAHIVDAFVRFAHGQREGGKAVVAPPDEAEFGCILACQRGASVAVVEVVGQHQRVACGGKAPLSAFHRAEQLSCRLRIVGLGPMAAQPVEPEESVGERCEGLVVLQFGEDVKAISEAEVIAEAGCPVVLLLMVVVERVAEVGR